MTSCLDIPTYDRYGCQCLDNQFLLLTHIIKIHSILAMVIENIILKDSLKGIEKEVKCSKSFIEL